MTGREVTESARFEAFFRQEFPLLVRTVYVLTRDLSEAEDIAQETFVRLYLKWDRVQEYEKPSAWLRRVAIHLASSWRRRMVRTRRGTTGLHESATRVEASDPQLHSLLLQLPFRQRAAIVLHYLEDRPIDEVAAVMECAAGTVKVHLHRARQRLASLMKEANNVIGESAPDIPIERQGT